MTRRVVITGMGVIAPNARDLPQFLSSLKAGRSGISKVESLDTSRMRARIGGEIKGLGPPPPDMDRVSQLGLIAAQEAVKNSGLALQRVDLQKAGVVVGTVCGGILTFEKVVLDGVQEPDLKSKVSLQAPARFIAKEHGFQGGELTVSNACAAGTAALGLAFDRVRYGEWDLALAGGCESFYLLAFAGFHSLRSLDPVACRPFDREREGLVVGEGAGFLVLESLEHAKKRGAKVLAEVAGYGLSSDAYHETTPEPSGEGAARAIQAALRDAKVAPEEVSYINAHGTGTPHNDAMEIRAIKQVFKEHAYKVPVSSIKSMIGHLMGAAGAVEAVASVLAIAHGFVPPTINYKVPDPECDLDLVPNHAREKELNVVLSSNFGFGGTNAAAVFKRFA